MTIPKHLSQLSQPDFICIGLSAYWAREMALWGIPLLCKYEVCKSLEHMYTWAVIPALPKLQVKQRWVDIQKLRRQPRVLQGWTRHPDSNKVGTIEVLLWPLHLKHPLHPTRPTCTYLSYIHVHTFRFKINYTHINYFQTTENWRIKKKKSRVRQIAQVLDEVPAMDI